MIYGWCSFSARSTLSTIKRIASVAVPITTGGLSGVAKAAVDAVKQHGFQKDEPVKGKQRDGYGRVRGQDRFAAKEGGIIVCMPASYGPIYAHPGTHLDGAAEEHGRLHQYVQERLRDRCFFPCRAPKGMMEMAATEDGPVHLLAFDSEYEDNEGVYEVEFSVHRGSIE